MVVAGLFRAVRRGDHVFSGNGPRQLSPKGGSLDISVFRRSGGTRPMLLVAAPRRAGPAVERNRFRRRVRMAFLSALWKAGAGEPLDALRCAVLWVRPAKGRQGGCRVPYRDIERQIESALGRLGRR
jgi:RNase P protein component